MTQFHLEPQWVSSCATTYNGYLTAGTQRGGPLEHCDCQYCGHLGMRVNCTI